MPFPHVFDKKLELLKGVEKMRRRVSARKDSAHFRRTAAHTKAVNLGQYTYRGGLRF